MGSFLLIKMLKILSAFFSFFRSITVRNYNCNSVLFNNGLKSSSIWFYDRQFILGIVSQVIRSHCEVASLKIFHFMT